VKRINGIDILSFIFIVGGVVITSFSLGLNNLDVAVSGIVLIILGATIKPLFDMLDDERNRKNK
jgi:drug/metabolite transporter (DMT)-like permease